MAQMFAKRFSLPVKQPSEGLEGSIVPSTLEENKNEEANVIQSLTKSKSHNIYTASSKSISYKN